MSAILLTTDILGKIFLLLQASHHNVRGLPPHIVLSHVTGRWRTLALDMPILWADIQVTSHSNLHALRESILRSRDCELDVSIVRFLRSTRSRALRSQNLANIRHRLSLITPLAFRWYRLSVSGDDDPMTDIMPLLLALRFPRLQSLELFNTSNSHIPHFGPFNFDPCVFTTLRLHRVTIHAFGRAHLEGLESLEVERTSCCMIDQASLDSLSEVNPPTHPPAMLRLRRLSIILAMPTFPLHLSFDPASLVFLKFGGFNSSSPALIPTFVNIFNAIPGPNLRYLELEGIVGFAWNAFVQSLQAAVLPRYSGLETLTLRSLELRNLDADFASAFPAITRLILVAVNPDPLHSLLKSDGSVWPGLVVSIDPAGNSV